MCTTPREHFRFETQPWVTAGTCVATQTAPCEPPPLPADPLIVGVEASHDDYRAVTAKLAETEHRLQLALSARDRSRGTSERAMSLVRTLQLARSAGTVDVAMQTDAVTAVPTCCESSAQTVSSGCEQANGLAMAANQVTPGQLARAVRGLLGDLRAHGRLPVGVWTMQPDAISQLHVYLSRALRCDTLEFPAAVTREVEMWLRV